MNRGGQDRERLLGALILIGAVVLALLVVAIRLGTGRAPAPTPLPPPPTLAPTVPAPAPSPTAPPATPLPSPPVVSPEGLVADGRRVVCLDPGHGGADQGNVRVEDGRIVLQEKDLTLQTGLALADRLRADGIEVVLTRTTDTEVNPNNTDVNGDGTVAAAGGEAQTDQLDDLQARVTVCNQAGADLLISIHYNSSENAFLSGYEVWYNDKRPFSDRSAELASLVHEELGARMAAAGYDAVDKGIGIEDHAVTGPARPGKLVPSAMPGVVVEGLFLSNDDDAAFIVTPDGIGAIVTAYEQAILRYFAEYPG